MKNSPGIDFVTVAIYLKALSNQPVLKYDPSV